MSDVTVSYRAGFRKRAGSAVVARAVTAPATSPSSPARVLALAHFVERQVRAGALKDYRDAAARLDISHARMSQITALLMLAPAAQADVILGRDARSEHGLRRLAAMAAWNDGAV